MTPPPRISAPPVLHASPPALPTITTLDRPQFPMATSTLTGLPVLPSDALKLDHIPLWDIYRQLGINYGDRVFARVMDADDEETPLENITWRKLLIDATKVANVLKKKMVSIDGEKVTYGLLANSSYAYYVNIVAGWLNHWTVSLLQPPFFCTGLTHELGHFIVDS